MRERGYVPVTIYLRQEDVAKVDALAEKERRKRSAVVVGLVLDGLKRTR